MRYAVLGIPFFLNGAMFPPSVVLSAAGQLIGLIVFGALGATVYLYLFNRRTRQSLHDLAVGSFVVKRSGAAPLDGSIWRPHLAVVAAWLVVAGVILALISGMAGKGVFPELRKTQLAIYAMENVYAATVTVGKTWEKARGETTEVSYLQCAVLVDEEPDDYRAATREVAAIVLENCGAIAERDMLQVTIVYGFDIGIARTRFNKTARLSPAEWQAILDENSGPIEQAGLTRIPARPGEDPRRSAGTDRAEGGGRRQGDIDA